MTIYSNRNRLLRTFKSIVILMFLSITLNGCATDLLWDKHNINEETVSNTVGKPDRFFINQKENKICISYIPNNTFNSNQIKYLTAEVDKNYDLKQLADIFSNPEVFNINSIVVNKQIHTKLSKSVNDNLNIYLFGDISLAYFMFEKDADNKIEGSIDKIVDKSKLSSEYLAAGIIRATHGHQDVLKMLVKKQWVKKFGNELNAAVIPVAVIDKNGAYLSQNLKGANGILTEINPATNGIKYVKVMLDLDSYYKHISYKSCSPDEYPDVMSKYKKMYPLYFNFGDRGLMCPVYPLEIKEIRVVDNFVTGSNDWSELSTSGKSFYLFENKMEQRNVHKYSMPLRLVGTPFAVGADILASPFYAGYIVMFMIFGT